MGKKKTKKKSNPIPKEYRLSKSLPRDVRDEYINKIGIPDLSQNHLELFSPGVVAHLFEIMHSCSDNTRKATDVEKYLSPFGFTMLGEGTNIVVLVNKIYPGVVFKIALDPNGIADNFNDLNFCQTIPRYARVYARDRSCIVTVQERYFVMNLELINYYRGSILKLLNKLKEDYLVADLSPRNLLNYGIDRNGEFVIIDGSDLFPLSQIKGKELRCNRVVKYSNKKGKPDTLCGGKIVYNEDFSECTCKKCGRKIIPIGLRPRKEVEKLSSMLLDGTTMDEREEMNRRVRAAIKARLAASNSTREEQVTFVEPVEVDDDPDQDNDYIVDSKSEDETDPFDDEDDEAEEDEEDYIPEELDDDNFRFNMDDDPEDDDDDDDYSHRPMVEYVRDLDLSDTDDEFGYHRTEVSSKRKSVSNVVDEEPDEVEVDDIVRKTIMRSKKIAHTDSPIVMRVQDMDDEEYDDSIDDDDDDNELEVIYGDDTDNIDEGIDYGEDEDDEEDDDTEDEEEGYEEYYEEDDVEDETEEDSDQPEVDIQDDNESPMSEDFKERLTRLKSSYPEQFRNYIRELVDVVGADYVGGVVAELKKLSADDVIEVENDDDKSPIGNENEKTDNDLGLNNSRIEYEIITMQDRESDQLPGIYYHIIGNLDEAYQKCGLPIYVTSDHADSATSMLVIGSEPSLKEIIEDAYHELLSDEMLDLNDDNDDEDDEEFYSGQVETPIHHEEDNDPDDFEPEWAQKARECEDESVEEDTSGKDDSDKNERCDQ